MKHFEKTLKNRFFIFSREFLSFFHRLIIFLQWKYFRTIFKDELLLFRIKSVDLHNYHIFRISISNLGLGQWRIQNTWGERGSSNVWNCWAFFAHALKNILLGEGGGERFENYPNWWIFSSLSYPKI